MASFQILAPLQTYFNQQGELLAGGRIDFTLAGTTTATSVYGDPALAVNNGSSITLNASGFPDVEVFGDADISYRARMYDADGVLQNDQDNIQPSTGGFSLPAGTDGQFLGLTAGVPDFQTIRQVPDPTGHSGKVLGNDGTTLLWEAKETTQAGVVTHQTVTAAATTNIDLSLGLSVTLNQDVNITTLTFSNVPAGSFILSIRRVKDNTATARTITWPASVKWPGGTAPTLSSTANAIDEIALKYAGTTYTGTSRLAFA